MDSMSREVYGYIVASDMLGEAYVVPLNAAFRDMQEKLGMKSVSLPTIENMSRWLHRHRSSSDSRFNHRILEEKAGYDAMEEYTISRPTTSKNSFSNDSGYDSVETVSGKSLGCGFVKTEKEHLGKTVKSTKPCSNPQVGWRHVEMTLDGIKLQTGTTSPKAPHARPLDISPTAHNKM